MSNNNNNNGSYGNEKPASSSVMIPMSTGLIEQPEYANDPASGSFFSSDFKRHEDLKTMLDSNKDGLKLEAMKRIIGMVAKGKDASDLFPAVVKNVVSKNIEVKKLVYVYLVRYAEEQQDLALLSISTFQRALKDPNQLIRASALRVLSSVRVPVIIPIMMLAIKDAVNDMSPYVRKTVAHAIPKLYSLDPEQKDQLIEVIEKLLSDKTTLVVGSTVMAFEEVCPERIDLIHKNYRKLCNLLVDVEEWGQVIIMSMLTRYCRTQFLDPNRDDFTNDGEDKPFYEDEEQGECHKDDPVVQKKPRSHKNAYLMDPDHRLLLRVAKPLLQSRNAAVVMSVAQLYHHLAPKSEVNIVAKSLVRLLRGYREVQSVVLSNIATMSIRRKGMFEPYLKSFFIRSSDPTHIKQLKLEILTNLASISSISTILREFQTYVSSADKEFVASTIQAIGRCASNIKEVTDTCLNGLVSLMSNRSEAVVAESVVVIKKLLQMQPSEHKEIIVHMTRLVDTITVPMARASILWLLGEYSDNVPKIAPDVLRKLAKTFIHEENIVKLQVLTLATKLYLANPIQTKLLCQYVFNLAKYDQNYDIRDRSRFLRQLVFPSGNQENALTKHCKTIFLSTKPAPLLESRFKDRDQYQLGSLAHYINMRVNGYHDLPDFPELAPDPSVRNVEVLPQWSEPKKKKQLTKKKSFYSETEPSSGEDDDSQSSDDSSSDSDFRSNISEKETSEDSDSREDSSYSSSEDKNEIKNKAVCQKNSHNSEEEESEEDDASGSESSHIKETSGQESDGSDFKTKNGHLKKPPTESWQATNSVDLLLDLNETSVLEMAPFTSTATTPSLPTLSLMTPSRPVVATKVHYTLVNAAMHVPTKHVELINKIVGNGLHVMYRFTRSTNLFSSKMVSVEVALTNHGEEPIVNIKIVKKELAPGMEIHPFAVIDTLSVGATVLTTVGIDFNESTQPASFEILANKKMFAFSIKAPIGDLLQPIFTEEHDFIFQQKKLKGLNENCITCDVSKSCNEKGLANRIYEVANVAPVHTAKSNDLLRFAAQSVSSKSLVLLTIEILENSKAIVTINCEKMVIGSMLLREIKTALST